MGFFDRLFGRKAAGSQTSSGPSEPVRAIEIQKSYWTHNADEQSHLEARGIDNLNWRDLLRLHHLLCVQRLNAGPGRATATEKSRQTLRRLLASDSPYRPRPAMVWQGQTAQPGNAREPDLQGEFLNPSVTHVGCLEVYRVDSTGQPARLDFVGFDELSGVVFAQPALIRAAKLFYEGGRDEIVLMPLLYGMTWVIGNEFDRTGRMTRFVAHLDGEEFATTGASGLGVGQQDFTVRTPSGEGSLFGLGSVAEITFPLHMADPRFDEKARARGIDPDEVRRRMATGG